MVPVSALRKGEREFGLKLFWLGPVASRMLLFFIRVGPREGRKEVERRGRPESEIKARA